MNRYLPALVIIIVAILCQQFAEFPVRNAFTNSLSNWLHVPFFAAITAILLRLLAGTSIWVITGIVLGIAVLTEALQFFNGRTPSIEDLGRDVLGVAIAIVFLRKRTPQHYLTSAFALAVVTLPIPGTYLAAYAYQVQNFPMLYDPAELRSTLLTMARSEARLTREHPWQQYAGGEVLHIKWTKEPWPGIHLLEPVEHWLGHDQLVIDAYNLEDAAQPLTIDVAHTDRGVTSRHHSMTLKPGHNQLRVDVSALARLDSGEPASIKRVIFHTADPHFGKQLLLGRVRLE